MANPSLSKETMAKKAAGQKAVEFVKDGMLVGLGSGTTSFYFIESLGERCREGLQIQALATSEKSKLQALAGGIPLLEDNVPSQLDIAVDGADEIDGAKRMIKGGGGALLREKIIAAMSKQRVVIIDESKYVKKLGKFPLAVEIIPFAYQATLKHLEDLGYRGSLRQSNEAPYLTDHHNYIFDIVFRQGIDDALEEALRLKSIPGVIETGLFINLANIIIMGCFDGRVEILP